MKAWRKVSQVETAGIARSSQDTAEYAGRWSKCLEAWDVAEEESRQLKYGFLKGAASLTWLTNIRLLPG